MNVDSGAAVSCIGKELWKKLGSPELGSCQTLRGYMGSLIPTLGKTLVTVHHQNKSFKLPIYVIDGNDTPLMGLEWMKALRISIKFDGDSNPKIHNVNSLQCILDRFPRLFSNSLGNIRGYEAIIRVPSTASPTVWKYRPVPFAIRDKVELELDRLLEQGIIERVDTLQEQIKWASPIVSVMKPDGSLRVCADFKVTINKYLEPEPSLIPRFEDIINNLYGGTLFSVIDLKDAYLQMNVSTLSRKFLTISTHKGFYRYKRLPFGISSAPAIFQRYMDSLLGGLRGVSCYLDDIIITGKNIEEHLTNLEEVLVRLEKSGITTQINKCKFLQPEIKYLGHIINKDGIHPCPDKTLPIKNCKSPENSKELKSFLGAIGYYSKFIPMLHAECTELYQLTQKNKRFLWSSKHEQIFQSIKSKLSSEDSLIHYDPSLPIILRTDASNVGIGAVLLHKTKDGIERPIISTCMCGVVRLHL
ncbi:Transposon Tf2-6 polyprotein [Thelohanellus kitauei]|uniref:Transposon Tf2-6 polyprotein n=1 Tax=Thelohanellus kitauei TaxID=669202 RepID=A0A0C2MJ38_THEKT|nr:Transposon Tf2-6 polyprotein [Thelohanellus kitauei]